MIRCLAIDSWSWQLSVRVPWKHDSFFLMTGLTQYSATLTCPT